MENVEVKDNLGAELELDTPPSASLGTVNVVTKGNSAKVKLSWTGIENLASSASVAATLVISTDENPGQGRKAEPKNEYTEEGTYYLNSGATLKFIDSVADGGTGFQLSAHTPRLEVEAYED
jgi:hypothetical protein